MNFDERLIATEQQLRDEADSLGELLEQFGEHIPFTLVGGQCRAAVLACAREFPATMAAWPFGFELRLHEARPRADLGVSLVCGSKSEAFFRERGRSPGAAPFSARMDRLLQEMGSEESPIHHAANHYMALEYDIDPETGEACTEPGVFLHLARRKDAAGDYAAGEFRDTEAVVDALARTAGWNRDDAEIRQVERVCSVRPPHTYIGSVGAFPRRERKIRLAVLGFRRSRDLAEYLERIRWPGRHSPVESTLSRFERRGGYECMGLHLDVRSDELGPALGLSFFAKERIPGEPSWRDPPDLWTVFLDGLREEDIAVGEKLSAMAGWAGGPTMLFAESGRYVLLRCTHHVKLVMGVDKLEGIKAYAYMILATVPHS